jgi:drug/metabolite transporter (DMT)-like permease
MNAATATLMMPLVSPLMPPLTPPQTPGLAVGIAVGLLAAGIGALYTVFARWGIAHGLHAPDLTVLRFGVAGFVTLPLLLWAWRRDAAQFTQRWRLWAAVALLAGTPFGLLMFGALQFAPPSHAAVFPFAAMSVIGLVLSAVALGDRLTVRKGLGIAVVLAGLVLVSGVQASSFTVRAALGDAMFIAAGTLWAGFGILLRKHRLDPLLTTAVVSFSALVTYVPVYLIATGGARLLAAAPAVLWIEMLVQGLIAGAGTLFTYAKMVSLLGPSRAAIFPALAPGLAALLAWPVLGHVPTAAETAGLVIVMAGLVLAVTGGPRR